MKILSFNIRGVGSGVKKKKASNLIRKQGVVFRCLQEIKIESMNEMNVNSICGGVVLGGQQGIQQEDCAGF